MQSACAIFYCNLWPVRLLYFSTLSLVRHDFREKVTERKMCVLIWSTFIRNILHTHSEYLILIVVPRQQWLSERASMLRYTYIAASPVSPHDTSTLVLLFVVWKAGECYSNVARQRFVQLCWRSYMIQQWQGSGADGVLWHRINCTCSAGPPYWAPGTVTTHKSDSLICQKKRSRKWMKSSFLFPACVFLPPCVSFLYTVLGDLCQGRYKMLGDDFYSFIQAVRLPLVFTLRLFFLFFIFIPSVFRENSVDKSSCQAWLRSIKGDIGKLQFQRAALSRKSLSVRMKSFNL